MGEGDGEDGEAFEDGVRDADLVCLLRSSDVMISSKSLGCLHLIANDTACTFATVDISTLACFESRSGFAPSDDESNGALLYFPLLKPLKGELRALDGLIAKGPAAPVANELLLP